jgi:hypothetical protein
MKVPLFLMAAFLGGVWYMTGVDPLKLASALADMLKVAVGG